VIVLALLPVFLAAICFGFWTIYSWKTNNYKTLKNKAVSSIVILLFFVHPNIV
jgi:hypothetical protein